VEGGDLWDEESLELLSVSVCAVHTKSRETISLVADNAGRVWIDGAGDEGVDIVGQARVPVDTVEKTASASVRTNRKSRDWSGSDRARDRSWRARQDHTRDTLEKDGVERAIVAIESSSSNGEDLTTIRSRHRR
jgi:hypothetical protein